MKYNGLGDKLFDGDYREHTYMPPQRKYRIVYPYLKAKKKLKMITLLYLVLLAMLICFYVSK